MNDSPPPGGETVSGTAPPAAETTTDSPGRAIAAALGLGLGGPAIALLSSLGIALLSLVVELSLGVTLALGLFFGQYVAFAGLAIAYLRYRGLEWADVRSYLGVRFPSLKEFGLVIGGWIVIFALILIISTIIQAIGTQPAENQTAVLAGENPDIILPLILAMFLVVGPCEEILYRGVVQGRLRESLPAIPSIIIASAIFAVVHVMALTGGAGAMALTVSILFVPSLVFGAIYEYTGNIVVPALLHGVHNSVLLGLLYITIAYGDELGEMAGQAALVVPF
ncbi:CPBP family intramembrane glutamic endopeptidase [Halalkalirubrum salinum]|uniref:CPBP family intramembrane glutamic endopeptidase n=1 Tax=Halalkalirubrum salinum TaxID=2563889 RepID=UPI0010FB4D20|nr:CPBP family intramembrane glutamic endopeptidase [Halalkalirubrum salinum]